MSVHLLDPVPTMIPARNEPSPLCIPSKVVAVTVPITLIRLLPAVVVPMERLPLTEDAVPKVRLPPPMSRLSMVAPPTTFNA